MGVEKKRQTLPLWFWYFSCWWNYSTLPSDSDGDTLFLSLLSFPYLPFARLSLSFLSTCSLCLGVGGYGVISQKQGVGLVKTVGMSLHQPASGGLFFFSTAGFLCLGGGEVGIREEEDTFETGGPKRVGRWQGIHSGTHMKYNQLAFWTDWYLSCLPYRE